MKRWLALALTTVVTAGLALPLGGCLVPVEATPTPAPVDLGEILGRAAGIASLKYDQVFSVPAASSETMTHKMWEKGNKARSEGTEGGREVVTIVDRDKQRLYVYVPAENTATSYPLRADTLEQNPWMSFSPRVYSRELANPAKWEEGSFQVKVGGADTVEGKACVVVEYVYPEGHGLAGKPFYTAWIWIERGIPLRVQIWTLSFPGLFVVDIIPGGIVIEFKNMEFVDIPDSMFELPPGVQITERSGLYPAPGSRP